MRLPSGENDMAMTGESIMRWHLALLRGASTSWIITAPSSPLDATKHTPKARAKVPGWNSSAVTAPSCAGIVVLRLFPSCHIYR